MLSSAAGSVETSSVVSSKQTRSLRLRAADYAAAAVTVLQKAMYSHSEALAVVLDAAKCGIFYDAEAHLSNILVRDSLRHPRVPSEAHSFPAMDGHLYESPPATC